MFRGLLGFCFTVDGLQRPSDDITASTRTDPVATRTQRGAPWTVLGELRTYLVKTQINRDHHGINGLSRTDTTRKRTRPAAIRTKHDLCRKDNNLYTSRFIFNDSIILHSNLEDATS
ncbi:hypothetical protein DPMN_051171 [Dreissena polymorpha]|uniref:Uncharacterized protein n=1 Tax=Dreissena polymorpha TaxID=45954 RepID=A0A9D4HLX3_DREPO|nr:hypothetical protein DPMN_051171 [Dreissena polymorpha]